MSGQFAVGPSPSAHQARVHAARDVEMREADYQAPGSVGLLDARSGLE